MWDSGIPSSTSSFAGTSNPTKSARTTSLNTSPTDTSDGDSPTSNTDESTLSGLSQSDKIGLGVGIPAAVAAIVTILVTLIRLYRKKKGTPRTNMSLESQPHEMELGGGYSK